MTKGLIFVLAMLAAVVVTPANALTLTYTDVSSANYSSVAKKGQFSLSFSFTYGPGSVEVWPYPDVSVFYGIEGVVDRRTKEQVRLPVTTPGIPPTGVSCPLAETCMLSGSFSHSFYAGPVDFLVQAIAGPGRELLTSSIVFSGSLRDCENTGRKCRDFQNALASTPFSSAITSSVVSDVPDVPLPPALPLLGAGLAGLGGMAWAKRRGQAKVPQAA